jgi:diguanylate cyclase (GGDEF)-like protein
MTRLLSHAYFEEHGFRELERARRKGAPLAYAIMDLDRFKSVNDRYGHAAGDRVLKTLAVVLRQRLRRADVIGRYGGEEFAVLFPDTDVASAYALVDRIRTRFGEIRHRGYDVDFTVTFSAGIAGFPRYGALHELYEAADRALYRAKAAGRNRVEIAVD